MRTPSLLVQCLPGLRMNSKGCHGALTVHDSDLHLASPAVEIVPPKVMDDVKCMFTVGYFSVWCMRSGCLFLMSEAVFVCRRLTLTSMLERMWTYRGAIYLRCVIY